MARTKSNKPVAKTILGSEIDGVAAGARDVVKHLAFAPAITDEEWAGIKGMLSPGAALPVTVHVLRTGDSKYALLGPADALPFLDRLRQGADASQYEVIALVYSALEDREQARIAAQLAATLLAFGHAASRKNAAFPGAHTTESRVAVHTALLTEYARWEPGTEDIESRFVVSRTTALNARRGIVGLSARNPQMFRLRYLAQSIHEVSKAGKAERVQRRRDAIERMEATAPVSTKPSVPTLTPDTQATSSPAEGHRPAPNADVKAAGISDHVHPEHARQAGDPPAVNPTVSKSASVGAPVAAEGTVDASASAATDRHIEAVADMEAEAGTGAGADAGTGRHEDPSTPSLRESAGRDAVDNVHALPEATPSPSDQPTATVLAPNEGDTAAPSGPHEAPRPQREESLGGNTPAGSEADGGASHLGSHDTQAAQGMGNADTPQESDPLDPPQPTVTTGSATGDSSASPEAAATPPPVVDKATNTETSVSNQEDSATGNVDASAEIDMQLRTPPTGIAPAAHASPDRDVETPTHQAENPAPPGDAEAPHERDSDYCATQLTNADPPPTPRSSDAPAAGANAPTDARSQAQTDAPVTGKVEALARPAEATALEPGRPDEIAEGV